MIFSHERLNVYREAIDFVAWSGRLLAGLDDAGSVRSQLERASTSIPLNIAEGNVKSSPRDRRRYWEIALGSAVECAAILDVMVARHLQTTEQIADGKAALVRIVSMLIGLVRSIEAEARPAGPGGRGS